MGRRSLLPSEVFQALVDAANAGFEVSVKANELGLPVMLLCHGGEAITHIHMDNGIADERAMLSVIGQEVAEKVVNVEPISGNF